MEYFVKKLTWEQMEKIYVEWIHEHFPEDEIKPLKSIQRMWDNGEYQALGMYEKTTAQGGAEPLIGYAFFIMVKGGNQLLLDYLAIVEKYRSKGAGSIFLKEMKQQLTEYKGILIETEDIDCAQNEEERNIRQKRDAFYVRNGAVRTGIRSHVYGVDYVIWTLPIEKAVAEDECRDDLEKIYRTMVPGEKYEKFVMIK